MALSLGEMARRALAALAPRGAKAQRDAALAREAATTDVLRVIASSPDDLAPVFRTILAHAVRLCEAAEGWLFLLDGARFKPVAHIGVSERLRIHPRDGFEPGPTYERMIEARGPIQVEERAAEWEDAERYRLRVALGVREAKKTGLYVPMFRGADLIGAIHVHRREMRTFTGEQMALVANFAQQALVAIDNARLLAELRVAVDRQAASSEVLGVISSSPGALEPAFDAMLDHAMRICAAERGGLLRYEAGRFSLYAQTGWPPEFVDTIAGGVSLGRGTGLGQMVRETRTIHIVDMTMDEVQGEADMSVPVDGEPGRRRTLLFVPLVRDGAIIGAFAVSRKSGRPFSDTEIELVETFATQAVIAIGNARLLAELRQSLDRQNATAEVLNVIAASPGELEPVFAAMLENAIRICAAKIGWLFVADGERFRLAATLGLSPDYVAVATRIAKRRGPETAIGRLAALRRTVQIEDLQSADSLARGDPFPLFAAEEGIHSALAVPMLKDEDLLGAIVIFREEASRFMDEQVALVENFAAQAVIAIENSRLVTDLQESHERETATAEMVGAISTSAGDLATVFDTLLENATRLTEAETGVVFRFEDGTYHAVATRGVSPALGDILRQAPVRRGMRSVFAQIAQRKETIHLPDAMEGPGHRSGDGAPAAAASLGGIRTSLFVPMIKDGALVGVVQIFRYEVRPFTDRQIALVEGLAAQAAIGIENTRLLTELRLSDERHSATAGLLRVMAASQGELQPVLDGVVATAIGLCGADFAILRRREGDIFRAVAQHGVPPALADFMTQHPALPAPERQTASETDLAITPAYAAGRPHAVATVELGGAHSCAVVPMVQDGHVVGEIALFRQEVRPFTEKQIELAESLAVQAAVALENARLREDLAARDRDLAEAGDRQAATAEMLRVIAAAPGDLGAVFDRMLTKALTLCEAPTGLLYRRDGDAFVAIASAGVPKPVFDAGTLRRAEPQPGSNWAQMLETKATLHCVDVTASAGYRRGDPGVLAAADLAGMRTVLYVPLVARGEVAGVLIIFRCDVRPFTDRQIELVEIFAAQAVIAIENAQLVTDLRARGGELAAAVREQGATLDVLGAIAASPGDAAPVFAALLDGVARVCEAPQGQVLAFDGASFRALAARGVAPQDRPFEVPADSDLMRMVMGKETVHQPDLAASPAYRRGHPPTVKAVDEDGVRAALYVPMIKDGRVVGALCAGRSEARPFSDREIELARNFAAQAGIAIENARLLTELHRRTDDVQEALEREIATGEVLKVISRSAVDLDAVLQTVVTAAVRLCRAEYSVIFRNEGEGDEYRWAAGHGLTEDYVQYERANPIRPGTGTIVGRVALEGRTVRIEDAWTDPLYEAKEAARAVNARAMLGVPLLREGTVIGVIGLARSVDEPFSEREVQLVTTFADQAVIAIENARLFGELRESLERQTATADILRVIASTPGDPKQALDRISETAQRIFDAPNVQIRRLEGDVLRVISAAGPAAVTQRRALLDVALDQVRFARPCIVENRQVHVLDVAADAAASGTEASRLSQELGIRTQAFTPLTQEGRAIGVLIVNRNEVRPFNEIELDLMRGFADQAVIAIENARLLSELRESLERQTATSEVLSVISASPGDLAPVFETMLENAIRICDADYGLLSPRGTGDASGGGGLAMKSVPPAFAEFLQSQSSARGPYAFDERRTIHVIDAREDDAYVRERNPVRVAAVELGGARTFLRVLLLLKENEAIGQFALYRQDVRPFTDKQIELVENFAAQAVIAIENARLLGELRESLDRQTATADILRVIASTPGDPQRALDTIAETAVRMFGATNVGFRRVEGNVMRFVSTAGPQSSLLRSRMPDIPFPGSDWFSVSVMENRLIHFDDLQAEVGDLFPALRDAIRASGVRTAAFMPLTQNGKAIGAMAVNRAEIRPFRPDELELMKGFADQAVIAIENARLLTELRARTDELTESLEQQTATSEVLGVISASPGELQPVFDSMVENAVRLCQAAEGTLFRLSGKTLIRVASHGMSAEMTARTELPIYPGSIIESVLATKATLQLPDYVVAVGEYERQHPERAAEPLRVQARLAIARGIRTVMNVPLIKDGEVIGAIFLNRREVRPFSDKQIALIENFAAQAVIAIENARLLAELRESLDRQTATAEVLGVISASPGDLKPVFETMLANATRLCGATQGHMSLYEGGSYRLVAMMGLPADYADVLRRAMRNPGPATALAQVAREKRPVQIFTGRAVSADSFDEPLHAEAIEMLLAHGHDISGVLGVPMLKDNEVIGTIIIIRNEVAPFTDKQIELVENFAAQAVIAIENARLLGELRARTDDLARAVEEQKALGEVMQAVNSSLDLGSVLATIVANAARLSQTEAGAIYVFDGGADELRPRATHGMDQRMVEAITAQQWATGATALRDATAQRAPVQIADLRDEPPNKLIDLILDSGFRALLVVPLLRPDREVGALVVRRRAPGEFAPATVELLATFAAQCVIAIENARLFGEIEEKSRELAVASQHKSQFLANMSHELRTPLNAILGYTELVLDDIYGATPPRVREVLTRVETNGRHLLGLINDVLDLSKIEAGQLTLALGEFSVADMVRGVYAAVEPLATEKRLALRLDLPEGLPSAHGDERRLSQVLLNLVGNAIKFTDAGEVRISATAAGESLVLAVSDTGPGIAPEDQAKIFEEFQQADNSMTRKKGGTGLGLAISRRIVELHGGSIGVESQLGRGSVFSVVLPVGARARLTA